MLYSIDSGRYMNYLGLRVVIAVSFARIHRQNLINFGILPLTFADPEIYRQLEAGETLVLTQLRQQLEAGDDVEIARENGDPFTAQHQLSPRQRAIVLAGGSINRVREKMRGEGGV